MKNGEESIINNTIMSLSKESDSGNIEYKLKIKPESDERIERLTTQMKYRVEEGNGEAIYYLGVRDDGYFEGITEEDYKKSLDNLETICKKNDFSLTLLSTRKLDNSSLESKDEKSIYEFLVRINRDTSYIEVRVAVSGNVDVGKSSLVAVLTTGDLDDGRGKARLKVFNFKHEVQSGRTSSIAHHIIGFDSKGKTVDSDLSWPEIVSKSRKIIYIQDLCGHSKYLKTTISGLSSIPDLCLLLVGGNMGVSQMTKEHLFLCIALKIKLAVVITKTDICKDRQNILSDTITDVNKLLKLPGVKKVPFSIKGIEDVMTCLGKEDVVPIFQTSNVSGEGIELLRQFLNLYSPSPDKKENSLDDTEFRVDNVYKGVQGVGLVCCGFLISGKINVGDNLYLGPNGTGAFESVKIKSIYSKKMSCQEISKHTYICLGLKRDPKCNTRIRKGSVIVSKIPKTTTKFVCDIFIVKTHATTIKIGYEPQVHVSNVRQTAKIIDIVKKNNSKGNSEDSNKILRTGDRAEVLFSFRFPEYLKINSKVIFTEGATKIIGKIIELKE